MAGSTRRAMAALLVLVVAPVSFARGPDDHPDATARLFARDNLIAWCIVPFDSRNRGPEDRAAMLERLGFRHFAYDWRPEHEATFDAEIEALKKHGIALDAFWLAPGEMNREARLILDTLKRHDVKAQLWVLLDLGGDKAEGAEQERRIAAARAKLKPLAEEASKAGCSLALYNHGGWFGEPENQITIIERLKAEGVANVGMVYNLHHGHEHLDRFAEVLQTIKPYLMALNLNGMDRGGDTVGRKILPLGQGALDLQLLRTIRDSGYRGPIGILGHTQDDAEERLKDNLDGLDWLVPQLEGKAPGPKPKPRTPVVEVPTPDEIHVEALLAVAKTHGNPARGAAVFADSKFACSSCHKIGGLGGVVGPDLSSGACPSPEQLVASVLWPGREVKPGYSASVLATADGRVVQGYVRRETDSELVLTEAATGTEVVLPKAEIEDRREAGSLMPEGLANAMTPDQRRDLFRFLIELKGLEAGSAEGMVRGAHKPVPFAFDNEPLHPEDWPNRGLPVNRFRPYDFYAKEAEHFAHLPGPPPMLLPEFPGLEGAAEGHWGTQNEKSWVDARWSETDLGTLLCGVFRGAGVIVPKAVCIRLGDRGEMAACFNPETLCYEAVWTDGFVKFSDKRHGFLDGLILDGTPARRPEGAKPAGPFVYHGFYRHGDRVVFSYRIGDEEMLDSPWVEDGKFVRSVGPAKGHPLAAMTRGGPKRWPQVLETKGEIGPGRPYAVDTIAVPFANPWKAPMFFGGLDFLPDGSALLGTMQGDVWRVEGLDDSLARVHWRRVASGLHQALGLVVADGIPFVLGRDQITRLHDLDDDGEYDFHECVSNVYKTSPGHDFLCGLQRDAEGNFYTASGPQGILKISADGRGLEILATGFRNPDGLALAPDGAITVPASEGEWTPASTIYEIEPGEHYGYRGPRDGKPPGLPLVYLPRGLDNSSGSQAFVADDRWGPLKGLGVHFSFGAGTHFLILRDRVNGKPQGAVVPLVGDFRSGVHRGRFSPADGQLYVAGMAGWGTYTADDGCFQRVRYTGDPVQLPTAVHAHENGVRVEFSSPVHPAKVAAQGNAFAQSWNYRYGPQYGSPEYSTRHPDTPGHDPVPIRQVVVLPGGKSVFYEMPDLQPVNQLHLHVRVDDGRPIDLFATIHAMDAPFTAIPGYRPEPKTIAAHPLLADLARMTPPPPNPWREPIDGAREIVVEAGTNLTFAPSTLTVRAGEPIALKFVNPDAVPHNWALARPGSLARVGDLANRFIANPEAVRRHYVPFTHDVLAFTDIVEPGKDFVIYLKAPDAKGKYPFLCTFPGHWMVMNGVLNVE